MEILGSKQLGSYIQNHPKSLTWDCELFWRIASSVRELYTQISTETVVGFSTKELYDRPFEGIIKRDIPAPLLYLLEIRRWLWKFYTAQRSIDKAEAIVQLAQITLTHPINDGKRSSRQAGVRTMGGLAGNRKCLLETFSLVATDDPGAVTHWPGKSCRHCWRE